MSCSTSSSLGRFLCRRCSSSPRGTIKSWRTSSSSPPSQRRWGSRHCTPSITQGLPQTLQREAVRHDPPPSLYQKANGEQGEGRQHLPLVDQQPPVLSNAVQNNQSCQERKGVIKDKRKDLSESSIEASNLPTGEAPSPSSQKDEPPLA